MTVEDQTQPPPERIEPTRKISPVARFVPVVHGQFTGMSRPSRMSWSDSRTLYGR